MSEPALQIPNDHLNRRLLRKAVGGSNPLLSLLEVLCTDSIYSFKDDFDEDTLRSEWYSDVSNIAAGAEPFVNIGGDSGWISGSPGFEDDDFVRLFSRARWSPSKRCAVAARFDINDKTNLKFEFGFVSPMVSLSDLSLSGVVNVKATPTANSLAADFAVAVLDRDDNTALDLIVSRRGTVAGADQSGGPTLTNLVAPFTILVATLENGGSRIWLNGAPVALNQSAYASVTAFHGTTGTKTESADLRESSVAHTTSGMAIWLFVQNRAAAQWGHEMRVDYVQAWQERVAVD